MLHALVLAQAIASPSPSPWPAITVTTELSAYGVATRNAPTHADLSNALVTIAKPNGTLRFAVTAGAYAFPVVGAAFASSTSATANTGLFSWVPQAYVAWAPDAHWTISAGQQATLLGPESNFTYQNVDIQRGLGWNAEPTFSRGIRAGYANGAFSAALEFNDGYHSGSLRAIEGSIGYAPVATTNVQFAFIVPDSNAPANPTAGIANKTEYELGLTQKFGKATVTPYWLHVESPANAVFTTDEHADLFAAIGTWQFSAPLSLSARYETIANASAAGDLSGNADLVGYGPGSSAASWTLTPQYTFGRYFVRLEGSRVSATGGFTQSRTLLEAGVAF